MSAYSDYYGGGYRGGGYRGRSPSPYYRRRRYERSRSRSYSPRKYNCQPEREFL